MRALDISTPKFPNTFAIVDDEDYENVCQWKWRAKIIEGKMYVVRSVNTKLGPGSRKNPNVKTETVSLHRFLLSPSAGMVVDHINGNPLDNRRENLRVCSTMENVRNRMKGAKTTSSKYKGVYWNKHKGAWVAKIRVTGRHSQMDLGKFRCEEDAARAYNAAAVKYHGEFARLNEIIT
jgi:hypothetical protein